MLPRTLPQPEPKTKDPWKLAPTFRPIGEIAAQLVLRQAAPEKEAA